MNSVLIKMVRSESCGGLEKKLGGARGVFKQFFSNSEPRNGSNAACLCHVTWPEKNTRNLMKSRHGLAQGCSGAWR